MVDPSLPRRPSPVLLIIPLVLTLAGIGLSVALYLKLYNKDPKEGTLAAEKEQARQLAEITRQRDGERARIEKMRAILGYPGGDYRDWLDREVGKGVIDVKTALDDRHSKIKALEGRVGSLKTDKANLNTQIAQVQKATKDYIAAKRAEKEQKLRELESIDQDYRPRTDDLLKRIIEDGKRVVEREAALKTIRTKHAAQKKEHNATLIAITEQIVILRDALYEQEKLQQRIDGRVVSVPPGTTTVVIDIGRQQRVRQGMVFKVVGKGQVVSDPRNPRAAPLVAENATYKGEIEVTRVFETQSRAVLSRLDFTKPMLPGDGIVNAVFNPHQVTRFVAVGRIDFDGDGEHDPDVLRRLVSEIGGVIEDEVTVQTDFLVVGQNWPTVEPELRKRYWRDQAQIKKAEEFLVSFLSVRRLLEYVGVQTGRNGTLAARTD